MSTPQPSFKGLPIQINVFAEFVKRWALDNNTSYAKALKSKKMKKDFYAYRDTLPLSKPIQQIAQFAPSSFMKADISPNQPNIPSDVADIAPEMGQVYPEQSVVEEQPSKIRIIPKKSKKKPLIDYEIEEEPVDYSDIPPLSPLPEVIPSVWQQIPSTTGKPLYYNPETTESTYIRPEGFIIEKIEGGKLSAPEIKSFVSASYIDHPDPTIDDWLLDTKLSNETAKVYYNPKQKRAVVVHRGTQGLSDWGNNLAYVLGGYEMTDRYKMGKDTQNKAEKKYGAKNISTLGHSQGAILARKLGANTKEIITVNPAYKFEKPLPNEFVIRSSSDVVSGAYAPVASARSVLMPKKSQNRDITIPSENRFDVLGEHSSDILDRLPANQMIGAGIRICGCGDRSVEDRERRYEDAADRIGININATPSSPIDWATIRSLSRPGVNSNELLDYLFRPEILNRIVARYNHIEMLIPEYTSALDSGEIDRTPNNINALRRLQTEYADLSALMGMYRMFGNFSYESSSDEDGPYESSSDEDIPYESSSDESSSSESSPSEESESTEGEGIKKARPYKIQTILFSKDKWTKRKASSWLKKHNYSNKGVDDKPDTLRYRQLDPSYVEQIGYNQYVTKPLGDSGVSLVIVYK